jgi:polyhydroxyalkanoate synthesis regulator phasin
MANKNTISEIINQTRKIEKNNHTNIEYTSNISSLINSNSFEKTVDKELEKKIYNLKKQIKDINKLTSELLDDLSMRHN